MRQNVNLNYCIFDKITTYYLSDKCYFYHIYKSQWRIWKKDHEGHTLQLSLAFFTLFFSFFFTGAYLSYLANF